MEEQQVLSEAHEAATQQQEPARPQHPILATGEIVFSVQSPDGPVDRKVDVLWLKLTCEAAEKEHCIGTDSEGRLMATAEFLDGLAQKISVKVPECTPTMAWQMWIAAADAMTELKNAMSGMPN